MAGQTVYSDDIFIKCQLFTIDKSRSVVATLRDAAGGGRLIPDLLRQDGTGFLIGRLVEPPKTPTWLKPGSVLTIETQEQRFNAVLTYQPIAQSRIAGVAQELGDKIRLSYVVTSEFKDV